MDDGVLAVGQRLAPPHELLPAPVEHAAADELRHVGPERGPEVVLPLAGDADAHRQPRADQLPGGGAHRPGAHAEELRQLR